MVPERIEGGAEMDNTSEPAAEGRDDASHVGKGNEQSSANVQPPSRLELLKRKIRKLQGKDPDIYPMW
jgi:hypothetical protein